MWGTDGIRIETVDEGWVFSAVDHFNAECVGGHAVKIGNRFAALEPIAQGLTRHFGSTSASAARGLCLRFDHGTQTMADPFLNQVRFWGIAPSPAFVAEPQTNGVAERFNRTLKEQAIRGRVFRTTGTGTRWLIFFVAQRKSVADVRNYWMPLRKAAGTTIGLLGEGIFSGIQAVNL